MVKKNFFCQTVELIKITNLFLKNNNIDLFTNQCKHIAAMDLMASQWGGQQATSLTAHHLDGDVFFAGRQKFLYLTKFGIKKIKKKTFFAII